MNHIAIIEKSFSSAYGLEFHLSEDASKGPSVVVLLFPTHNGGDEGYRLLAKEYGHRKLFLSFTVRGKVIDLSIIARDTGDAINVEGLAFKYAQFYAFQSTEGRESSFAFVPGLMAPDGGMALSPIVQEVVVVTHGYATTSGDSTTSTATTPPSGVQ